MLDQVESGMSALPSLVFDLDGTLIDSVPDLQAAVNRMLAAENLAPMERAEVQSYVGDGAPTLVRRVMAARGLDEARHAELTDRLVTDYTARASELTLVHPNVSETLDALKRSGHRLRVLRRHQLRGAGRRGARDPRDRGRRPGEGRRRARTGGIGGPARPFRAALGHPPQSQAFLAGTVDRRLAGSASTL